MNTQTVYTRPMKMVIFGLLGFTAAAAALALAKNVGMLDATGVKRGLGLLIGVMVTVTGNFLPKLRPLHAPGVNPEKATNAAERLAGWTLVLAGISYIGLFAFAPLERARTVSAILGIAALALITANWGWLVRGALRGGEASADETATDRAMAAKKRRLIVPLLFAFFYVLATASAVFLFRNQQQIREVGWWMSLGFWFVYAVLMAALDPKRPANREKTVGN